MPYKMISIGTGINDPVGVSTRVYKIDEVIPNSPEWVDKVGKNFVKTGHAIEIQGNEPIPMVKNDYETIPSDVEPKPKKEKKKKSYFS
tara:strand:- start:3774 stop:4037 length:264 start_codon:yes stop_codon:yes gene_type:complete